MSQETIQGLPPSKIQLLRAGVLLTELPLTDRQEWLLGSGEGADLRVQHATVDAAHARLFYSEGELFVEDLRSRSGTFVRGRRVEAPVKLGHRDQVLLGQHYVVKPLVVRYFDAATHVLEELGLVERPAAAQASEPRRTELATRRPATTSPDPASAEEEEREEGRRRLDWTVLGRRLWKPLALVGAGALAVTLLLSLLKPSFAVWRSAEVSPTVISAGDPLVIQGQDILPQPELQVQVAGQPAAIEESRRGRLVIRVPPLPGRAAGTYDVPVVVRTGRIEAFQAMLRYVVRPRIERIEPAPAEVGGRIRVIGAGLADDVAQVSARLADVEVPVLSAAPTEVVLRVPVLTRTRTVAVPVEVTVGGVRAVAEEPLTIHPRRPRPVDFGFTVRYAEARDAWELQTQFGPVFYLPVAEGDEPGERTPPPRLRELEGRWDQLLEDARRDAGTRVLARSTDEYGCELLATTGEATEGAVLAAWPRAALVPLMAPGRDELSDEMLCPWFAGIWNQFLQAFGRGAEIDTGGPLAAWAEVLNGLVARNRSGGGTGRPEQQEIDELGNEERENLRRAFLPVPQDLGSVAGRWRIALENLRAGGDDAAQYVIDLDLTQRAGRLSGQAQSAILRQGIEVGFGQRSIEGSLQLGAPTRVTLRTELAPPIGTIELRGVLESGRLGGQFTANGVSGNWTATRR